jgi:hypothetical protein
VRVAEAAEVDVLTELMENAPSPAVALVALFKEALDSRGIPVEQRLRELLVSHRDESLVVDTTPLVICH